MISVMGKHPWTGFRVFTKYNCSRRRESSGTPLMFTLIVGYFACCPALGGRDVPIATAMRITVGAADSGAVPRKRTRTLDLEETPMHHRHGIVACGEPRSRWTRQMAT